VRLEGLGVFLCAIISELGDLEESVTIARGELSTVVVKLTIVNVLFMLGL
jgi:hypothetical protein